MTYGEGCRCPNPKLRFGWVVVQRNCNHSAFNGYRWTPSVYSAVRCTVCEAMWRTKARYVDVLLDGKLRGEE